jgi:hypothetical protein
LGERQDFKGKENRPSAWCIGFKKPKPKYIWIQDNEVYSPKKLANKPFEPTALGRPGICLRKSRAGALRISTKSRNPPPVLAAQRCVSQTKKRKIIFWEKKKFNFKSLEI